MLYSGIFAYLLWWHICYTFMMAYFYFYAYVVMMACYYYFLWWHICYACIFSALPCPANVAALWRPGSDTSQTPGRLLLLLLLLLLYIYIYMYIYIYIHMYTYTINVTFTITTTTTTPEPSPPQVCRRASRARCEWGSFHRRY